MKFVSTIPSWKSTTSVKVLFVLVIGAMFVVTEAVKKYQVRKDLEEFQGEWVLQSSNTRMGEADERIIKTYRKSVVDNRFTVNWKDQGGSHEATFILTLDPTQDPKAFDMVTDSGQNGNPVLGIYKIEGDTHTVCYAVPGDNRPPDFDARHGSLNVWRRAK